MSHCLSVLEQSKALKCDFLGLAGELRRKYPKQFRNMDCPFSEALSDISFDVTVNSEIKNTYAVSTIPFTGKVG